MLGHYHGPTTECRLSERPTSESSASVLEPGSGEPEGTDTSEKDSCRLLYRHIIIQAIHDLGYNRKHERESIREFSKSEWFSTICVFADWDDEWVRKIFSSVDALREEVRREVTTQITKMMKLISVLET